MSNVYNLDKGTIDSFRVVVEIPFGSQNKYEIDPESGLVFLDRVLYGTAFYPFNYGFIPGTKAADGDAADVGILLTNPVPPSTVVECRAIGLVRKVDSGETDNLIIAVANSDPGYFGIDDVNQLPAHIQKQIVDFFENMQKFKKGQWLKNVNKVEGVFGKKEAMDELSQYFN